MSTTTSTLPDDANEIRRRMATIRRELHEDVRGVVQTAEAATDWRRYVTAYPWVSVGVAFALGYVLVPRKHKVVIAPALQADLSQVKEAVESTRQAVAQTAKGVKDDPEKRKKGLVGAAFGLLVPVALKAAQSYAVGYLEQWLAAQQAAAAGPPPVAPTPGTGPRPGPTGPGRPPGAEPRPRGGPWPV